MRFLRELIPNLALALGTVFLCLLILESGLRIVPNQFERQFEVDKALIAVTNYRSLGDGLYTLKPNVSFRHAGACFDVRGIKANSQGFRGRDWREANSEKIVLLGDSLVEGLQVEESKAMGARLAARLGQDVASAGVSGYSTVTELLAYQRLIRPYRPKLVILAFYLGNDIEGNSCALSRNAHLPCARRKGEELELNLPKILGTQESVAQGQAPRATAKALTPAEEVKWYFRSRFVTYQLLHAAKVIAQGLAGISSGRSSSRWSLYLPDGNPDWDEAWVLTEKVLSLLKHDLAADGARLVILGIPEHFTVSPDWKQELLFRAGYMAPDRFDPDLPMGRLQGIARRLEIPLLDPTAALRAYQARHQLPYPYFSFSCDGHLNPLGHDLMAQLLADWMTEMGFFPNGAKAGPAADPEIVLGIQAYEAIFKGGVYRALEP